MHRITLFIAAVAVAGPTLLAAQAHDSIARGSHIRLSVPVLSGDLITGRVIAIDDRRILFRPDDARVFRGDSLSVQLSDIQSIQVNRGPRDRGPSTLGYGALGSLAGAAAGALIWPLVSSSACLPQNLPEDRATGCLVEGLLDGGKRRDGALMFGAAGAVIGAVVGYLTSGPRWENIGGESLSVTITPRVRGVRIKTVIRF